MKEDTKNVLSIVDGCMVRSDKQMLLQWLLLLLSRPPLKHGVLRREHATYTPHTTNILAFGKHQRPVPGHPPVGSYARLAGRLAGRVAGHRGPLRDSERSRLFDGYIPVGSHKSFPSLHTRGIVRSSSRSTQTLSPLSVAEKKSRWRYNAAAVCTLHIPAYIDARDTSCTIGYQLLGNTMSYLCSRTVYAVTNTSLYIAGTSMQWITNSPSDQVA